MASREVSSAFMDQYSQLSMNELALEYPEAYESLPECYKADNCLDFWHDQDTLLAFHDLEDFLWCKGKWTLIA